MTSDFIVLELERRRLPFARVNTESLSRAKISFRPELGRHGWILEYPSQRSIHFSEVTAGYLRRPEAPTVGAEVVDETERQYRKNEWNASLVSALRSLDSKWLNSPASMLLAEDKPRQLAAAIHTGFSVPDTLVTNDFDAASAFLTKGQCIGKPLSSSLFGTGDNERVIFTSRISSMTLGDREAISTTPFILQREVRKESDLRVTVVGNRAFAAEIRSQKNAETQVDWRKGSHLDLAHRQYELPDEIAEKCIRITHSFGLKFSAIDFALGIDGNHWFLEMNPNGQWAWIEKRIGAKISEAIVDELESISNVSTNP